MMSMNWCAYGAGGSLEASRREFDFSSGGSRPGYCQNSFFQSPSDLWNLGTCDLGTWELGICSVVVLTFKHCSNTLFEHHFQELFNSKKPRRATGPAGEWQTACSRSPPTTQPNRPRRRKFRPSTARYGHKCARVKCCARAALPFSCMRCSERPVRPAPLPHT